MTNLLTQLKNDDLGFVVSAELILVATIAVLSMIVGLAEVSNNINQELEDVGSAFGSINQSYEYSLNSGAKGRVVGSRFSDGVDDCDNSCNISCDGGSHAEGDY